MILQPDMSIAQRTIPVDERPDARNVFRLRVAKQL